MKTPKMVDFIDYPFEPVCLPADITYALINDTIPLELHGDVESGTPKAPLCIGAIAARRGNEGKVIFSLVFRSPLYESLFEQIAKFSPMQMCIVGGSWPYKAVIGIKAWADGLGFPQQKQSRFQVTSLNGAQHEQYVRDDFSELDRFCKHFGKSASNIWVMSYHRSGLEGVNSEFGAEFMINAATMGDFDRLHMTFIEKAGHYRVITKHMGGIEWTRSNPNCIFHVKIRGTLGYIADFCKYLNSK